MAVVIGIFIGVAGILILTSPDDGPMEMPKQTICVEGTYLQPDNTCLPPNSISMKDK